MNGDRHLIMIGASAGGLNVFQRLVGSIAPAVTQAVVFIQHLPQDSASLLSELLSANATCKVIEIEDKLPIVAGLYVAPPGYHCSVSPTGHFALDMDAPVQYSRPSIDVLFESAARYWGAQSVGILLTGANADGSSGLSAIRQVGGFTIVQDPNEAAVATMPQAAIDAGAASVVWNTDQIAAYLGKEASNPR